MARWVPKLNNAGDASDDDNSKIFLKKVALERFSLPCSSCKRTKLTIAFNVTDQYHPNVYIYFLGNLFLYPTFFNKFLITYCILYYHQINSNVSYMIFLWKETILPSQATQAKFFDIPLSLTSSYSTLFVTIRCIIPF